MFGGVGSGKSFSGTQFAINHMIRFPDHTGFIGANSHDQLSQASLRELFVWLETYKIPYVVNQFPPKEWGAKRKFATYRNILSCKIGDKVAHAFIRVLSDPDALRGIQFSWYWIDETRDTPNETHDVLLSRMRESKYKKGLITTTTNGEDWGYNRFALAKKGQRLYGSIHVRTLDAVRHGILTQSYYDTMLHSYSELMVAQELDALHVNVHGGRAYYASSEYNRRRVSPWGAANPDRNYPLIIGCDFNFDPAPHIWVVGQLSPDGYEIHWFDEIVGQRKSTVEMAQMLCMRYQGFFFRVFGDRSGARATTSNAGRPDYYQMAEVFQENGFGYSLDTDQGNNPLVRNRVENMNRMFKDGAGEVRQTYNPDRCTHLDEDCKMVGWKNNTQKGQGKLDNGGSQKRTHASDGAGYAVWKLFPPQGRGFISRGIQSIASQELGSYR